MCAFYLLQFFQAVGQLASIGLTSTVQPRNLSYLVAKLGGAHEKIYHVCCNL